MGQANHFLITILIGLDEVGKGQVKKPETLDVCWNPKDVKATEPNTGGDTGDDTGGNGDDGGNGGGGTDEN
jgi:hypothetical protein